jgi:hypothetical protein
MRALLPAPHPSQTLTDKNTDASLRIGRQTANPSTRSGRAFRLVSLTRDAFQLSKDLSGGDEIAYMDWRGMIIRLICLLSMLLRLLNLKKSLLFAGFKLLSRQTGPSRLERSR